jgi:hypothetical protein
MEAAHDQRPERFEAAGFLTGQRRPPTSSGRHLVPAPTDAHHIRDARVESLQRFATLPLDVNGDGNTDLSPALFRKTSAGENPGKADAP